MIYHGTVGALRTGDWLPGDHLDRLADEPFTYAAMAGARSTEWAAASAQRAVDPRRAYLVAGETTPGVLRVHALPALVRVRAFSPDGSRYVVLEQLADPPALVLEREEVVLVRGLAARVAGEKALRDLYQRVEGPGVPPRCLAHEDCAAHGCEDLGRACQAARAASRRAP